MDTEQVTQRILADANQEARQIKQQAQEKEHNEQEKLNQQLAEFNKKTGQLAKKAADEKKMHLLASARMDIARLSLAEKRKILDEVFDNARQKLLHLPDQDYRELITRLMKSVVETGDEQVILDKKETRIDNDFIQWINSEISSDKKGNLSLSEQRGDLGGGFILKRAKIKTNVSFDVLLNQTRQELEGRLAKELFEE